MEPDRKRAKLEGEEAASENDSLPVSEAVSLRWLERNGTNDWQDVCEGQAPPFAHAFFGPDETIHGYRDLRVTLSIDVASFYALLEIEYASKEEVADDIRQKLKEQFEYDFEATPDAFLRQSSQFRAAFPPTEAFGEEILRKQEQLEGDLVVTCCRLTEADKKIKELHYRLEPFVMFFIDGAQCIDTADPNWTLFCAVLDQGETRRLIGYTTVYRCYAYPDRHRDRIGQSFVLPGHRRKGVGSAMLEAVEMNAERTDAVDVTIEDPTDEMVHMKRMLDVKRMMQCKWIHDLLLQKLESLSTEADLSLQQEERISIQKKLCIPQRDIEALWNALLLVECLAEPEKTGRVLECLKTNWSTALSDNVDHKVIFEELSASGETSENFVMTRCGHHGICKVIHGIMVIPPTSCPETKQQRESLVAQKLTSTLELATRYTQRHSM